MAGGKKRVSNADEQKEKKKVEGTVEKGEEKKQTKAKGGKTKKQKGKTAPKSISHPGTLRKRIQNTPTQSSKADVNASETGKKKKKTKPIHVLKLTHIPYGFFEKQLLKYFLQFGQVVRVRVSRSKKTGNHRGWAYVGFDNKNVAEIAVETMDGYLMFNKRLSCKLMEKPPLCMRSGPQLVSAPAKRGTAIKDAKKRLATRTQDNEHKAKKRRTKSLEVAQLRLKEAGIDYELPVGEQQS